MADLGLDDEESFDNMVKGCPEILDPILCPTHDDGRVELNVPNQVLQNFKEFVSAAPAEWKLDTFSEKKFNKLRSANPERSIMLRYLNLNYAWRKLNEELVCALHDGVDYAQIIHGKGKGVIKLNSRTWLIDSKWVLAYCEQNNNSGAVVAALKRARAKK